MMLRRPRVSLRRLRAADAAAWRDLRLEALSLHPEAYGASHDDWAGRPLPDFAAQLEAGCIFGAVSGDDLIGSTALVADGQAGEIASVYVRPDHRGRGVARRLLKRAVKEARARGMQGLTLSVSRQNPPAMAFYRRAGFAELERPSRVLARDGRFLDLIEMTRAL